MKDINTVAFNEKDQEILGQFEKKVKSLPLKERLEAALLFELFEEILILNSVNDKFNEEEKEKYDE